MTLTKEQLELINGKEESLSDEKLIHTAGGQAGEPGDGYSGPVPGPHDLRVGDIVTWHWRAGDKYFYHCCVDGLAGTGKDTYIWISLAHEAPGTKSHKVGKKELTLEYRP